MTKPTSGPFHSPLDRRHDVRRDAEELARRRADPASRALALWREKVLLTPEGRLALLPLAALPTDLPPEALCYLGDLDGVPLFAAQWPDRGEEPPAGLAGLGVLGHIPRGTSQLPGAEGELLFFAKAMANWAKGARFCGVCGAPVTTRDGGHVRVCANPACAREHFPRTDPAILVLPHRGDSCLLGRQASWPPGRYSALAGFVEPGESLEQAARREAFEETGIRLGEVRYYASEPWPFPGSLMVGFFAEALNEDITLDPLEMEHARWFTRDELKAEIASGRLVPPRYSLSGRLIAHWVDPEDPEALNTLGPLQPFLK